MLPLNPKKTGSRGCLQSFCFSLWLLFIFSPSQRTRRFYFKAYWQLQQYLMVPEHSSVHRSRCHITALGMVSEGRAEQERNPSRSRIPAGFVSPADSSISDPRPPLLMPEGRDQERDPKCLCSWGGCRRRRSGRAGCVSSSIWEGCSSYLHTRGSPSRTRHEQGECFFH